MIYLDHNATTPVLSEVLEVMLPYFRSEWGNPSSSYRFGSLRKGTLQTAREQVSELLGCYPAEVIFTSCATESNNSAIHAALKARPDRRHIITSSVEHSSVLNYCTALEREGYRVTYLAVDRGGLLNISELEESLADDTAVVSLMWANNETGVLFPVKEIGELCRNRSVLFHCDAVQIAGKAPINTEDLPVDYLSLTGHKFGAPKGIGALYVHRRAPFSSYLYGGHQERGRRGGTENVALVAGIGKAAEIAKAKATGYAGHVQPFRDLLEESILRLVDRSELNGDKTRRLSNTTNLTFRGVNAEALLLLLDQAGVCVSSGSACLADSDQPSHVIAAMTREVALPKESIRFSCGLNTTAAEIQYTIEAVCKTVIALREVSEPIAIA